MTAGGPTRVTWASMASREAMGLQGYERSVQLAMRALAPPDLEFATVAVASLRSGGSGARRVPIGAYHRLPLRGAMLLGAVAYRTRGLVHRFDLRIPPAPGVEVVTIHDLPPFHFSDEGTVPRSAATGARRARRVIVPSRFARDEVCELLDVDPDRVRVVPNGVADDFARAMPSAALLDSLGIGRNVRYVVHAAGATQRKNLGSLAQAWRALITRLPDVHLVLCGPPDGRRTSLFAGVGNVVLAGAQPPASIAALMAGADAVVVPSLYEGFGLPALEGMAAGAAVVAARAGALPEVCGDSAMLVDPDADGLLAGLESVLSDVPQARRLRDAGRVRAAGYTWARSAAAHLDVYRELSSG